MANVLEEIKTINPRDLSIEELQNIIAKSSKSLNQRIRRLEKAGLKNLERFDKKPKEYKKSSLEGKTKRDLNKIFKEIKKVASGSSSSTSGIRKTIKKVKEKTGVDISIFSSDDWSEIRQEIEKNQIYNSEDVIEAYSETYESDESVEDYLKKKENSAIKQIKIRDLKGTEKEKLDKLFDEDKDKDKDIFYSLKK